MYDFLDLRNPGFSFTTNYKLTTAYILDYISENLNTGEVSFQEFQRDCQSYVQSRFDPSEIQFDSKVRMILPVLRNIGVAKADSSTKRVKNIDFDDFFTPQAKAFRKYFQIYLQIIKQPCKNSQEELQRSKALEKMDSIFQEMMFETYFINYCKNYFIGGKSVYGTFTKYLIDFDSLNKYEFYSIVTLDFQKASVLGSYHSAKDWIYAYRDGLVSTRLYKFPKANNAYIYNMRMLSDFDICSKTEDGFHIKNKDAILSKMKEGGLL